MAHALKQHTGFNDRRGKKADQEEFFRHAHWQSLPPSFWVCVIGLILMAADYFRDYGAARRFSLQEEKLDAKLEIQKSKLVAAGGFDYDD